MACTSIRSSRPSAAFDLLDHHRQRVRQLVAHPFQRGLADQLGHQHLFGLVGELTVGVERRPGRQLAGQHVDQHVDLVTPWSPTPARSRRRWPDQFADGHQLFGHPVLGHLVDLGDDDDERGLRRDRADLLDRSTGRPGPIASSAGMHSPMTSTSE